MQLPTIHLNGSSVTTLIEQTQEARSALRNAIDTVQAASPHARDYYPQGDVAMFSSRREHEQRLAKLAEVLADMDKLIVHLYDHNHE